MNVQFFEHLPYYSKTSLEGETIENSHSQAQFWDNITPVPVPLSNTPVSVPLSNMSSESVLPMLVTSLPKSEPRVTSLPEFEPSVFSTTPTTKLWVYSCRNKTETKTIESNIMSDHR